MLYILRSSKSYEKLEPEMCLVWLENGREGTCHRVGEGWGEQVGLGDGGQGGVAMSASEKTLEFTSSENWS